jgi:hypothetical protein
MPAAHVEGTRSAGSDPFEVPFRWDEIPGLEVPGEPDPVEVERTTERVLDHVLARFGWARDARGHIEHVGEERPEGRWLRKAS